MTAGNGTVRAANKNVIKYYNFTYVVMITKDYHSS